MSDRHWIWQFNKQYTSLCLNSLNILPYGTLISYMYWMGMMDALVYTYRLPNIFMQHIFNTNTYTGKLRTKKWTKGNISKLILFKHYHGKIHRNDWWYLTKIYNRHRWHLFFIRKLRGTPCTTFLSRSVENKIPVDVIFLSCVIKSDEQMGRVKVETLKFLHYFESTLCEPLRYLWISSN